MTATPDRRRQRLVSCQDPEPASAAAHTISGLEYLHAMATGELPSAPIGALMGMTGFEVQNGRGLFRAQPGEEHLNPTGTVHGGFAATLLDSALGCAVHTTLPAGVGYTTIDLNVTSSPRSHPQPAQCSARAPSPTAAGRSPPPTPG